MKASKKMALTGVLCALAVAVMLLGGLIPLATFCCPAVAAMLLVPVFVECGERLAWAAWGAVALLGLMLCPDKEAALLYVFIGHYPVLRWRLEQIRGRLLRVLAKLGVFNLAVVAMYALCIFVFRLNQLFEDYLEMGLALTALCLLIGNVTLLLYDRLVDVFARLYVERLRRKLL